MRIVEAQEAERARLAQEVHDGPAQALSNAIFQVEFIDRVFESDPPMARSELGFLRELLRRELGDVRGFLVPGDGFRCLVTPMWGLGQLTPPRVRHTVGIAAAGRELSWKGGTPQCRLSRNHVVPSYRHGRGGPGSRRVRADPRPHRDRRDRRPHLPGRPGLEILSTSATPSRAPTATSRRLPLDQQPAMRFRPVPPHRGGPSAVATAGRSVPREASRVIRGLAPRVCSSRLSGSGNVPRREVIAPC